MASSETMSSAMISPLHTILGGLTLTAQLLSQLSSSLDIILPKRFSMNDFGLNAPSSELQFIKKLIRLNINVAHLCLSQGLDIDLLKPTEALHNLAQFLTIFVKNGHLGSPYKLDSLYNLSLTISNDIEKQGMISNVNPDPDLESDNEDDSFNEDPESSWESVVPSDMMIVHPMLGAHPNVPNSPSPPPNPYTVSSVAGSFMSSWLRGITSPTNSPTSPHK